MSRRALIAAIAWALSTPLPAAAAGTDAALVPAPASLSPRAGAFRLARGTPVVVPAKDMGARRAGAYLVDLVERTCGLRLALRAGSPAPRAVSLARTSAAGLGAEGYALEVLPARATITARTDAGLLYGAITFAQLACRGAASGAAVAVPAIRIDDAPRFAWRGIMLDSARHFQSPQFIRRFIDWMALHKLNVLHWHLTDDQAWRLEIRKYPALTGIGAWRVPAGPAASEDIDPATGKARLYGGFYSQDTVRGLVAYAAARAVTIVPEIEMPGHASAAIASYPALAAVTQPLKESPRRSLSSTLSVDWGIYSNVYNLDEPTFAFLEDVLTEVMALFPGKFIHIGGDEVEKTQWRESPAAQARMRELGITDPAKLQIYFTQRIVNFLDKHGRRPVGWDEILDPALPRSAVVMSWRGIDGALAAAAAGHDTVLSPWPTLYLDNLPARATPDLPGRVRVVSLEDIYRFDPMPGALAPERRHHVLGLQGNVWTEHIRTEERVAHMTFPRAAAIAELGWSPAARRDWPDFQRRLAALEPLYAAVGLKTGVRDEFPPGIGGNSSLTPVFTSQELDLCSEHIALNLEDDAPVVGPRAVFKVDIMNPCWMARGVDLDRAAGITAAVGQLPFNFQIGEDVKKIVFPKPVAPEGELEVRLDSCEGEVLARLPVAPAARSHGVTALAPATLAAKGGKHDLCLRFAQPALEPLWVIDRVRFEARKP